MCEQTSHFFGLHTSRALALSHSVYTYTHTLSGQYVWYVCLICLDLVWLYFLLLAIFCLGSGKSALHRARPRQIV